MADVAGGEGDLAARLAPSLDALARALAEDRGLRRAAPSGARRFLEGWREALARVERVAGERGAREPGLVAGGFAVAHAVPALDGVAFALRRSRRWESFLERVCQAQRAVAGAAGGAVAWWPAIEVTGVTTGVTLGALESQVRALGLDPTVALEVERVASRERAGTLVAVERRGVVEAGRLAVAARLHVASGGAGGSRGEVLEAALAALEAGDAAAADLDRLGRELDRCEGADARASGEAALRFAHAALERARAVPEARRAVLDFLQERGIAPIALGRGERFEPERHPPAAFERRGAPGEAGVVLATLETGFRDARGVVLARAVVVVGAG